MSADAIRLTIECTAIGILLGCSAFFSGSETALLSLTRAQARRLATGTRQDRRIPRLLRQPQRILSTIVVGNMIVNVMLASLIAGASRSLVGEGGVPAAIALSTVLLLVFGEVTPKTIAVQHSLALSKLVALPLDALAVLFTPLRVVLRGVADAVLFVLGQPRMSGWGLVTRKEIASLLALGEAEGVTTEKERFLIDNILALSALEAHDIMIPRTEVIGLDDSLTFGKAYADACRNRHSRMVIYHEHLDDCWGVFNVVDMPLDTQPGDRERSLASFREGLASGRRSPGTPIYPVHLFPESARLDQLLQHMRTVATSMVVLVDEYGGTAGILTLDDILAEIVGQISAEKAADSRSLNSDEDGLILDGRTHLRDVSRMINRELEPNGSDTIGGYVTEHLGRLARAGDEVTNDGLRFTVIKMAGRRIGTLRITRIPTTGQSQEEEPC